MELFKDWKKEATRQKNIAEELQTRLSFLEGYTYSVYLDPNILAIRSDGEHYKISRAQKANEFFILVEKEGEYGKIITEWLSATKFKPGYLYNSYETEPE